MAEREPAPELVEPELVGKPLISPSTAKVAPSRSLKLGSLLVFAVVVLGLLFAGLTAWAVASGHEQADDSLLQNRTTTIAENARTRAIECNIERRLWINASPAPIPPHSVLDECGVPAP